MRTFAPSPPACSKKSSSRISAAPSDLDDGWGVEVTKPTTKPNASPRQPSKKAPVQQQGEASIRPDAQLKKKQARKSPFMDMTSEQGLLGLTLLKAKLMKVEEGKGALTSDDKEELFNSLPRIAKTAAEKQAKRLGKDGKGSMKKERKVIVYEDDDGNTWEELEDEEVPDELSFELNVEDENLEYVEYDRQGRVVNRTVAKGSSDEAAETIEEDLKEEEEEEEEEVSTPPCCRRLQLRLQPHVPQRSAYTVVQNDKFYNRFPLSVNIVQSFV
jgi:hypothetical protein